MAAAAAHHWMTLMLIASVAGGTIKGSTTQGAAPTIKLIAPRPPSLAHIGLPSTSAQATDEIPATGPYQATSAEEGVHYQLNSCSSDTSKTLPLPPSSTVVQGMGGMAAAALNNAVCRPGNTYLAQPAPTGQLGTGKAKSGDERV